MLTSCVYNDDPLFFLVILAIDSNPHATLAAGMVYEPGRQAGPVCRYRKQ